MSTGESANDQSIFGEDVQDNQSFNTCWTAANSSDDENVLSPDNSEEFLEKIGSPPGYGYWRLPGEKPELYEHVGIRFIKKYIPPNGDWFRRNIWLKFKIDPMGLSTPQPREQKLRKLIGATKVLESTHLGCAALIAYWDVKTGRNISTEIPVQFAINGLPIMIQRYNRLRAANLLLRLDQRSHDN